MAEYQSLRGRISTTAWLNIDHWQWCSSGRADHHGLGGLVVVYDAA
jgi:hypothetical protein